MTEPRTHAPEVDRPIVLSLGGSGIAERERAVYRIAASTVEVRPPLAALSPFRADGVRPGRRDGTGEGTRDGKTEGEGAPVYRGPAWIGDSERQVTCRATGDGLRVDIAGVGRVEVSADGSRVQVTGPAGDAEGDHLTEAALGPGLILALATRGIFCLHASSVDLGGTGLVLFVGPSGAGKSTIGRLLDGARPGWRRASDDILPVALPGIAGGTRGAEGAAVGHPRFPQLKNPPSGQPGAALPETVPLHGLFFLAPPDRRGPSGADSGASEASDPRSVRARPVSVRRATLGLLRHTASARLFDRHLLACHLELCAALAERLPAAELRYPWTGALVEGLPEAVAAGPEAA